MTPPPKESDSTSLMLEILNRVAILEAQNAQIIAAQGRAEQHRQAMHEELRKFPLVASTVERIEPIVLRLENIRLEALGASKVATAISKALYMIAGAIIAAASWMTHLFVSGVPVKHP